MRASGWRARIARVYRPKAGTHRWFGRQLNDVHRTQATHPSQIWVADLTYLGAVGRWWFLAVVLDQYSRRLLAWRLARTRTARLMLGIVEAACRRGRPPTGLIFIATAAVSSKGRPSKSG